MPEGAVDMSMGISWVGLGELGNKRACSVEVESDFSSSSCGGVYVREASAAWT